VPVEPGQLPNELQLRLIERDFDGLRRSLRQPVEVIDPQPRVLRANGKDEAADEKPKRADQPCYVE
jgi:hypothetical protein